MVSGKITSPSSISGNISKNSSIKGSSTSGGGSGNHDRLFNRDLPDQHPIKAITDLQETLDEKLDSKTVLPIIEDVVKGKAKGLYFDAMKELAKKSYWYLTSEIDPTTKMGTKDSIISGPYDLGMGGGSGGGGSLTKISIKQVGWPSVVVSGNSEINITIEWSSVIGDEKEPTGNGTIYLSVNDKQVVVLSNQAQGIVKFNVADYIISGTNTIQVKIMDMYGTVGTTIGTLNAITLDLKSSFDYKLAYPLAGTTGINYTYIPYGDLEKKVHFIIDEVLYGTQTVRSTGEQQTFKINSLAHGSHKLEVYFTAKVGGTSVQSKSLIYDLIYYDAENPTPIIASDFNKFEQEQYIPFNIPYRVFIAGKNEFDVELLVNEVPVKVLKVNADEQYWEYKNDQPGNYNLAIRCGVTVKSFDVRIIKSKIEIVPIEADLALSLNAQGRTNAEPIEQRTQWADKRHNINCILSNFNWSSDGWIKDMEGNTVLRVTGDARVEIPYMPFEREFNMTGKTIELELATSTIRDYESPIISCLDKQVSDFFESTESIFDDPNRTWTFKVQLDQEKFKTKVQTSGKYYFEYTELGWIYNEELVDLQEFGIEINYLKLVPEALETEPHLLVGDSFIIEYSLSARGFYITPQSALFRSQQSSLQTQYKEDEHIRLAFVIDKKNDNRIIWMYINGIASGAVQYAVDDSFRQIMPSNITIGSNDATVDIYNIRVYDNNLTSKQVVNNWIADTQNAALKAERYYRNDNYNDKNEIVISKIAENLPQLPYIIWDIDPLPQYKGDKRLGNVRYVEPMNSDRNFTAENATYNVQGTSSAVYPTKNIRIKYKQNKDFPNQKLTWYDDNGDTIKKFAITGGGIGDNYFTYKVDYASSEGANNVELVKLYNDASKVLNILTPPQRLDAKIRVGIDGYPIIAFHRDSEGKDIFWTKANFNNDKANEDVYGFKDGDESWEITNNTSDLAKFKIPATSENFSKAFEIRFPDKDGYNNLEKLGPMTAWVASTYTEKATNDPLDEPITFTYTDTIWSEDGSFAKIDRTKTFEQDTAEYRLTKFKAELKNWFDVDSTIFYYLFTHLYLMIDSRAKNAFPTYFASREPGDGGNKWFWLPYDMDTAIGIDNKGKLSFDYNLEDIDKLDGANVFNGQDSVMWNNVREAFSGEISEMYARLRTDNLLSYEETEKRFKEHQSKWSENLVNEDAKNKYINPLKNGDNYLEMLQGLKDQQRKWWLYNRFKYMDSKYTAGDAKADFIQFRAYVEEGVEKPNITVVPYADIYATVSYANGGAIVQKRAKRGEPTVIENPFSKAEGETDQETFIYSASQLKSIGDISGFKADTIKVGNAIKLQELKVGDADPLYDNPHLSELTLGSNVLLKKLDVRNCSKLAKPIDISGCTNIEEVYFEGTKITGINLPNGGILKVLHLPGTLTNLTIKNQPLLTDLTLAGNSNIETLWLENIPASSINTYKMLTQMKANSKIRLIGINENFDSAEKIKELYDILDTMVGLDNNGVETAKAQVTGVINVPEITYRNCVELSARYPEVVIKPEIIRCLVNFYNEDTLYKSLWVIQNNKITQPIADPTKEATESTVFTFSHWDVWTADTFITEDLDIHAVYVESVRQYTVRFHKQYDAAQIDRDSVLVDWNTCVAQPHLSWSDEQVQLRGWYLSSIGDDVFDFNTPITRDYDLYAQWVDYGTPRITLTRLNFNTIKLVGTDNVGVTAYKFVHNSTEQPESWIDLVTPEVSYTVDYIVDKPGYYYAWIKDSNGNTDKTKIDVYNVSVTNTPGIVDLVIAENGSPISGDVIVAGTSISVSADLDYHYENKVLKINGAISAWDASYTVISDINIECICDPKTYQIHFITGDKGTQPAPQNVKYSDKIAFPGSQYYVGYIIEGWYLDQLLTKPWNFDTDVLTADIIDDTTNSVTLYAKWVEYTTPTELTINVTDEEIGQIRGSFAQIGAEWSERSVVLSFTQAQANSVHVDWGDGSAPESSAETLNVAHLVHTYNTTGIYIIKIQGTSGINYKLGDGAAFAVLEPAPFMIDIDFSWDIQTTASYAFKSSSISNLKLTSYMREIATGAFAVCKNITKLNIPENIKIIGSQAFASCSGITGKVILPDTITTIGNAAFQYCEGITEINIPKNLTEIPEYCFNGCINLTSVEIPSNIRQIHQRAFMSCNKLAEVVIPESVQILGTLREGYANGGVFRFCNNLSKVIIKNPNMECYRDNFGDCSQLKSAGPIGSSSNIEFAWATKIPDYAFCFSNDIVSYIETITLPNSLKEIGKEAFMSCKIKKLDLPITLERIGASAFQRTPLRSISIPENVRYIGGTILAYCPAITNIRIYTGGLDGELIQLASLGWFLGISESPEGSDPKVHIVKALDSVTLAQEAFGEYWNVNDASTETRLNYSADL